MSSRHEPNSNTPQTVLVVDNLADVRGLIGILLTRWGYRVAEADGGEQAVEEARRVVPDLILMDLKMPGGMDGITAAQAIRGDVGLRGVPIVAVTADNTEYWRLKAREAGFSDYLVKPFEPGELEVVLERLLPNNHSALHYSGVESDATAAGQDRSEPPAVAGGPFADDPPATAGGSDLYGVASV